MNRVPFVVVVVALGACAACSRSAPVDKVTYVADDDPKMNAAIEKARQTVGVFTAALQAPKPGQTTFSIKLAFDDGNNVEHMWLTPVRFDGKLLHGKVDNTAEKVTNVKMGQEVSVEPSKISDWMFAENGRLQGGYTLRVLRDALTAKERADFDKSVPFVID